MAKKRNIKRGKRAEKFRLLTKPVDNSSPNPYFRSYPSAELATAKSFQRSQFLKNRLALLSKIRPKKGDSKKIVFVAIKRVKRGKKYFLQVYRPTRQLITKVPVYALKAMNRKFEVLNDPDPRTLAKGVKPMPRPQRLENFDVRRMQRKPIFYKQYLAQLNDLFRKRVITGKISLPKNSKVLSDPIQNVPFEKDIMPQYVVTLKDGNLDPFYKSAIEVWKQLVESQFRKHTVWQLVGRAIFRDGKKLRQADFSPKLLDSARFYEISGGGKLVKAIGRTKASRIVYTDKYLIDLYSRFIHAGMAGGLGDYGVFSKSSIRRIASLPQNRGKAKKEWTTRSVRGKKMDWPALAGSKRPVTIEKIIFQFLPRF